MPLRPSISRLLLAGVLVATFVLPARAESAPAVYGASSLEGVVTRIVQVRKGPKPVLRFDGSSRLAMQIAQGAPADLFLSADAEWVTYLQDRGRIDPATRVELAGNALVAVASPVNDAPSLEALLLVAKRIALAGENVPAGKYARAALVKLGLWERVKSKVVNGQNVRQALELVARGDCEAGIVFRTDAQGDARVRSAFELPASSHPRIAYVGAVVAGRAVHPDSAALLDWLRSPAAASIWREAGFLPPEAR